jgi:hypothetical protein
VDDVVDALAKRGAGGNDVKSLQKPRVLTGLQLLKIVTGDHV